MNSFPKFYKPCLFAILFIFISSQSFAQSNRARERALCQLSYAATAMEQDLQAAASVWELVTFDLTAGAGITPQTRGQLRFCRATLVNMTPQLQIIRSRARFLDEAQLMSDAVLLKDARQSARLGLKSMIDDLQAVGVPDPADMSDVGAGLSEMARLLDCIRREIQDIGNTQ